MTTLAIPMTVSEAYAFCRAIAHEHGANFSVGFRFLPARKRAAVYAAYAYCRWADDISDDPGDDIAERLDAWQRELDVCYAGSPNHPITIALADALQHFAIPKKAFVDLIDGCRLDITKHRYETFEELLHYCRLVASSISEISLAIFGYRVPAALEHGDLLATALQLTNVTRDVADDLERDRIYLPLDELARFGVTEEDLKNRVKDGRTRALIEFQIDRAESYFKRAEPLLKELDFDARFPVLLMGGIYATVLAELRKNPFLSLGTRISLPKSKKIAVVLKRVVRPHFV